MSGRLRTTGDVLRGANPDAAEIAESFDRLDPAERICQARSLHGRRLQRALWQAVANNPRISVADLIPPDYPTETPVVFHGKNSLPVFTEFQKICFRPDGGPPDRYWGYNETPIKRIIGPGYYVLRNTPDSPHGASAFDYTLRPQRQLSGWPELRPNQAGLSRFIYNGTIDYMRRVAREVFIGQATREGKGIDSYFVIVRELRS